MEMQETWKIEAPLLLAQCCSTDGEHRGKVIASTTQPAPGLNQEFPSASDGAPSADRSSLPTSLGNHGNHAACPGFESSLAKVTCDGDTKPLVTHAVFPIERRPSFSPRNPDLLSLLGANALRASGSDLRKRRYQSERKTPRRCANCQLQRKKCEASSEPTDPRCARCFKFDLSPILCVRKSITEDQPFQKWANEVYEILFTGVQNKAQNGLMAEFGHYARGPRLNAMCCKFKTPYEHQIKALKKDASGWHSMDTSAYCLQNPKVDITKYIDGCIPYVLDEVCNDKSPVEGFFRILRVHQENPLIKDCLRLFTCIHLLFIGWQLHGSENLGMEVIHNSQSPWHGIMPVPRMIQNQLGHLLELQMIALDNRILANLRSMTSTRKRTSWVFTTLAFFTLLHVRELDAGRNIFWSRYKDSAGFWIHPSQPDSLIEEEIASCRVLLSHYHSTVGKVPLTLNWDNQKSKDLLDNDEVHIQSMKVLQSWVLHLKNERLIGRKASDVYEDGKPWTVRFTISSLLYDDSDLGVVIGFH